LVREGVIALIEQSENGKGDRYLNWEQGLLPEFYAAMNRQIINQPRQHYDGGY